MPGVSPLLLGRWTLLGLTVAWQGLLPLAKRQFPTATSQALSEEGLRPVRQSTAGLKASLGQPTQRLPTRPGSRLASGSRAHGGGLAGPSWGRGSGPPCPRGPAGVAQSQG